MTEFSQLCDTAQGIARRAGEFVRKGYFAAKEVSHKSGVVDLVTETDKQCEEFIFNELRRVFPKHKFVGEESTSEDELTDEPTWIVDPIDGTTNFVHKMDYTCISIGFTRNCEPCVGVVYNPIRDVMYCAYRGGGAFKNGRPIIASGVKDLDKALVSTNIGSNRSQKKLDADFAQLRELSDCNVQSIRMQGSAALQLCSVAEGSTDCFFEDGIHIWDIAAGVVIVREAGAYALSMYSEEPLDITKRAILATSTTKLAETMRGILVKHRVR